MQRSMRTNVTAVTPGARELRVHIPAANIRLHSHHDLDYLQEYCANKYVIFLVSHNME